MYTFLDLVCASTISGVLAILFDRCLHGRGR